MQRDGRRTEWGERTVHDGIGGARRLRNLIIEWDFFFEFFFE